MTDQTLTAGTPAADKRRGGRPQLDDAARRDVRMTVRLTQAEADKLDTLGGAAWIRRQLAKART